MDIAVDVKAPTPPYEQIRAQVAAYVADGSLRAGDRLPTMRALAADLGVATGTVGRAYAELEAAGLVTSRRRTGTVVADGPARPTVSDDGVRRAAAALVEQARAAGLDGDTVLALVRAAWTRPVRRPEPADGARPVTAGGGPSAAGTARTGR
nr:GntR family transcriptional regulator [Geodermatophilus sabuli]